jgi:hypothetical protein
MRLPIILACLALCSCDLAPPPERQSEAAQKAMEHHELRDAIQKPIDRAKDANAPNEQHDQDQAKAIDDAGG